MIIIGIIFSLLSIIILYKRIGFIMFGNKVSGRIIGYSNETKNLKGIDTYNYKVEYEYNNKKYVASSLESVQVSRGGIPNKNLNIPVTVCFKKSNMSVVTILEFKQTTILGLFILGIGILLIIFDLLWLVL